MEIPAFVSSDLFDIDSSSGVVTVASELPEGVSFYQLNVVARDLGTPQESGMVRLEDGADCVGGIYGTNDDD